jgi:hypothetical protein
MRKALFLTLWLALPLAAQAPAMALDTDPGPSVLAFPIRVDLAAVFAEAERTAPRRPPGVETWTQLAGAPQGTAFRFDLSRDALRFSLRENRFLLRTEASYWLEVGARMAGSWYQGMGTCGKGKESPRRVVLGLRGEFDLTPDWGIQLRTRPEDPLPLDSCLITFLGYDITDKVVAGMKAELEKAARDIERMVSQTSLLRQQAERIWKAAQEPIELAPGIHLALNPERIRLSPWRSEARTLILTPELQARPVLTLGERPQSGALPLPRLETAAPVSPGFRVRLDLDLPFAEATRQLQAQVVGRRFDTEKGPFEILSASVGGQGGRAILQVQVKGRIEGTLALAGRPVFDEEKGLLKLVDLEYTLESRSWMTRFGEWLFRSSLRKTLQDKADWFLERSFAEVRTQLQQHLNRELLPGVTLKGDLGGLRMGQPKVLEDRFRVEAQLDGRAEMEVRGLAERLAAVR